MTQDEMNNSNICPFIRTGETFEERPVLATVSHMSPAIKNYWARWENLFLRDGVMCRKWENFNGKEITSQLILT